MPKTIKYSYSCIQRLHKRSKEIQIWWRKSRISII